ncbi:hypothetical protein MPSEU_000961300 [Mayamaea pseudoterrestris]|nr:hypothetical protein MPSEU_000961300 [Mayamaea pseudoterrestris]
MSMRNRQCWVWILLLVGTVHVDAARSTIARSRLLQNIFEHTKKKDASKQGASSKNFGSRGEIPMPSISPAPSTINQSKKSKKAKHSKGWFPTISPAPSSVYSSKVSKGGSVLMPVTQAPSLSQGDYSKKGFPSMNCEGGPSKKSKSKAATYPTLSPVYSLRATPVGTAPSSTSSVDSKKQSKLIKGCIGAGPKKIKGSKAECTSIPPSPTTSKVAKGKIAMPSSAPNTAAPTSQILPSTPTAKAPSTAPAVPTISTPVASPVFSQAPTSNAQAPVAPILQSPIFSTTAPTASAQAPSVAPILQSPIFSTTAPTAIEAPVASPVTNPPAPTANTEVPSVAPILQQPVFETTAPTAGLTPVASPVVTTSAPSTSMISVPPVTSPVVQPTVTTSAPTSGTASEAPQASPVASTPPQASETPAAGPTTITTPGPGGSSVDATPFSATYEGVTGSPSAEDCDAAAEITRTYLQTAFTDFFATNPFVSLDTFNVESFGCTANPARIAYQATAVFTNDSDPSALPVTIDLDSLLQVAFQQPMVTELTTELAALPAANPFASTSSVTYSTSAAAAQSREPTTVTALSQQGTSQQHVAIGFAASVCTFVFLAMAVLRRRMRGNKRQVVMGRNGSIVAMPYHSNLHESLCDAESVR